MACSSRYSIPLPGLTANLAAATTTEAATTDAAASNSAAGFAIGALILAVLLGLAFWIPAQRRRARSAAE